MIVSKLKYGMNEQKNQIWKTMEFRWTLRVDSSLRLSQPNPRGKPANLVRKATKIDRMWVDLDGKTKYFAIPK